LKIKDNLGLSAELTRKGIHLTSSVLPLSYLFLLNREQILLISCTISILFISAEIIRYMNPAAQRLFLRVFGSLLRQSELKGVTGATYLFVSATICFFLFEKSVAIASVLLMTLSDSAAAIAGKTVPLIKFYHKTVSGSLAFFLVSLVVMFLVFPGMGIASLIVILPVTLIEALPLKINDNLLISLSAGILLSLVVLS
jgi:dolichol kinase